MSTFGFSWRKLILVSFDPHIDAPAYQAAGVDMNVTFLMAVDAMDMTNGPYLTQNPTDLSYHSQAASKLCPALTKWPSPKLRITSFPFAPLETRLTEREQCIDPSWVPEQKWVPVEMPPGGMLLFGSFLAHRSGPNTSDRWRAGIYATASVISWTIPCVGRLAEQVSIV